MSAIQRIITITERGRLTGPPLTQMVDTGVALLVGNEQWLRGVTNQAVVLVNITQAALEKEYPSLYTALNNTLVTRGGRYYETVS